jgi:carbamoyltransferase
MTHLSTKKLLGINALNHDASVTLTNGTDILFAAHAERYSRIKNDSDLNCDLLDDCLSNGEPDEICWYEKPWAKFTRKLYSGESLDYYSVKDYLSKYNLKNIPIHTVNHHEAHAAMGYFTSGFDAAAVVVMDAIGEWNCTSIWQGVGTDLKRKLTINYPYSMGLFYSAVTQAVGLKPNEEEYILMGMAAYGKPIHAEQMIKDLFVKWKPPNLISQYNFHRGLNWYFADKNWNSMDIAASAQYLSEQFTLGCGQWVKQHLPNDNLVLVGGVSLNCVANGKLRDTDMFKNIWVPPNPGDSGLSLGAICAVQKQHIRFTDACLGYEIQKELDITGLINTLSTQGIAALAHGRAEFGPRALGNRSLLADPRGATIKDRVNKIKKRQAFRPFAPIVLEEYAADIFENVKYNQQYMQWTNVCRFPELYPAICHVDNTSRIQTVPKNNSHIRKILEAWHAKTGCPMLLNTSLNIKGQPLVNSWQDAEDFGKHYGVSVF